MWTPTPVAGPSLAQGISAGGRLADILHQGRQRRALPRLAEIAKAGDYQQLGAEMINAGFVQPGLNATNIPYQRDMENRRFEANQAHRAAGQSLAQEKFAYSQNQPQSPLAKLKADFDSGRIDQTTYDAAVKKATESRNGITVGPDGTVRIGGPAKAPTEGQAKANIYASRMETANGIINTLEKQGTDFWQQMASKAGMLGNYAKTPEFRQFEQAKRDFINATLRQESGAVISPAEFENGEKQYFPQPGDDAATIAQKQQNRITAMNAIREASGPFSGGGNGGNGGMTKGVYDSLPSGAVFEHNGKKYRKP